MTRLGEECYLISNSLRSVVTDHFGQEDEIEKKKGQMFLLGIVAAHVLFTISVKLLFY